MSEKSILDTNQEDNEKCFWEYDGDGRWWSACGQDFIFNSGGPSDNGFNYCHSCGNELEADESNTDF